MKIIVNDKYWIEKRQSSKFGNCGIAGYYVRDNKNTIIAKFQTEEEAREFIKRH